MKKESESSAEENERGEETENSRSLPLSLFWFVMPGAPHIAPPLKKKETMASPSPVVERSEAAALARLLQVSLCPPSTSELLYLPDLSKVRG